MPIDFWPKELEGASLHIGKSAVTLSNLIAGLVIIILAIALSRLAKHAIRRWRHRSDESAAPSALNAPRTPAKAPGECTESGVSDASTHVELA